MQVTYMNLGGSSDIKQITAACFLDNPLRRCQVPLSW
jgi:hypothetical protein